MSKGAIIATVCTVVIVVLAVCGWAIFNGNRDVFDFGNNDFNKAYICLGGTWALVDVKSWADFDDDVVQIKTKDGFTYLTQYSNIVLIKGNYTNYEVK